MPGASPPIMWEHAHIPLLSLSQDFLIIHQYVAGHEARQRLLLHTHGLLSKHHCRRCLIPSLTHNRLGDPMSSAQEGRPYTIWTNLMLLHTDMSIPSNIYKFSKTDPVPKETLRRFLKRSLTFFLNTNTHQSTSCHTNPPQLYIYSVTR